MKAHIEGLAWLLSGFVSRLLLMFLQSSFNRMLLAVVP